MWGFLWGCKNWCFIYIIPYLCLYLVSAHFTLNMEVSTFCGLSGLSFHHTGSWDWTEVLGLGSKWLYPMSHLKAVLKLYLFYCVRAHAYVCVTVMCTCILSSWTTLREHTPHLLTLSTISRKPFCTLTFPVAAIMLCCVPAGIKPLKGWLTCAGRLRLGACACGVVCCNWGWSVWGKAIRGCPADPKLVKESWDAGKGTVT